ncbi:MAG: S41 family peptidase [Novosphingobium sp.]
MMHRRQFLHAAALGSTAFAFPAIAQSSVPQSEDVRVFGDVLRSMHPGLHRYLTPAAFEAGLQRLDAEWQAQPALEARYLNLSRFLATLRCGHSYANFFNQKRAVASELFDRPSRLPFAFRWIAGQMVVLNDHSGTGQLPAGTVIKAINGVPAAAMLGRLMPYARADGHNDDKRRALLSVSGADKIEFFDAFHGLVYGAPQSGQHQLRVRVPASAKDLDISLPALNLGRRQAFMRKIDYDGDQAVWDWDMGKDGVARLTMDGWALFNSKWDWKGWLNDRLNSLAGAKGLIVDLRENEGGNDCGDLILSRLTASDIKLPTARRLVRYRKVPAGLNPYLDTWDDSFRDWGDEAVQIDNRFYRLDRWDDNGVLAAARPRITVPMAVLTGPQNSSATYQFAATAKASGLGTLIGGTTGGNQRGINGGAFFFVRLPESGIEFDVPLVGYFPQTPQPDAGIVPDLRVQNSARDIANGFDREMETARKLLLRG